MRPTILVTISAHLALTTARNYIPPQAIENEPDFSATKSAIWKPNVGTAFQMILSKQIDINDKTEALKPSTAEVFDVDLFYTNSNIIRNLRRLNKKVICYFSAGTAEDWRPDYKSFTDKDKGSKLPLWAGESYVDIRSANVRKVMGERIQTAKNKGCDAVDPDNLDVYINEKSGKFNLTEQDAVQYVQHLAKLSHDANMAMGLKNVPTLIPSVVSSIEFAVSESCVVTGFCPLYEAVTAQGKPVFHVEYVNYTQLKPPQLTPVNISSTYVANVTNDALRERLCLRDRKLNGTTLEEKLRLSTFIKTMDLDGWIMGCSGKIEMTKTVDDR